MFELPIEHGEHTVMKVVYDASMPSLPANLKGKTFEYIFGSN